MKIQPHLVITVIIVIVAAGSILLWVHHRWIMERDRLAWQEIKSQKEKERLAFEEERRPPGPVGFAQA